MKIEQSAHNEFIIVDNINFFEELLESGININFQYDTGEKSFSLEEIVRMEHFMQFVVDDIKSKNFSPLEQLIAVYDIAKVFKPYEKGTKKFTADSRSLYEYLDNEYMVCAGYADLILNLGRRLNAPYAEIGLGTGGGEGHARNYVNIVDNKYGIDGFYVLDATWEQEGAMKRTPIEELRSTYKNFLMTTKKGRNGGISLKWNEFGGYDALCTMQSPQKIRDYFRIETYYREEWFRRISILDPEFYKKMVTLDFSKDEDANVLIEYFKTKINNPVQKEKLLDAIIQVKKSIYVNLTEQDFEDMRMGYSMTEPFCIINEEGEKESLYGEEYNSYIKKKYEDIKSKTLKEAQEENSCINVKDVFDAKLNEVLLGLSGDREIFSKMIMITDEASIKLIKQNKDKIEDIGFYYSEYYDASPDDVVEIGLGPLKMDDLESGMTLEQIIADVEIKIKQLYEVLGVTKEVATMKLGEETIDEQNDTTGKIETLDEIERQMEEQIKEENNNESK